MTLIPMIVRWLFLGFGLSQLRETVMDQIYLTFIIITSSHRDTSFPFVSSDRSVTFRPFTEKHLERRKKRYSALTEINTNLVSSSSPSEHVAKWSGL